MLSVSRCCNNDLQMCSLNIPHLLGGQKLTNLNFHFGGSDYFLARNAPSMRRYSAAFGKGGWHAPPVFATRSTEILGYTIGTIQIASQFDEK
jgi:hypothetical protein